MSAIPVLHPVLYTDDLESPEKNEAEVTVELVETMRKISEKTFQDAGHATRSVHAKSHGVIRGEMQVLDDLPEVLKQGIFAEAAHYPVVMRLSTPPGDMLPDSVSLPRGLAIKILDVPGERLPGSENSLNQDFVMVNGPAFLVPDAKSFLGNLKLLAATTNRGEQAKVVASAVLQGVEKVVEAFGGKSPKLMSMGGHPETNLLGETFFTQVPVRYGNYVAKLSIAPLSAELQALKGKPINAADDDNALRSAVREHFASSGGEWALKVQLCGNLQTMPIEDASVVWPEAESPYVTVARIRMSPQDSWDQSSIAADDRLSFSPWHGVTAHRPLGSIMRARKAAYEMSARFRAAHNRMPMVDAPAGSASE